VRYLALGLVFVVLAFAVGTPYNLIQFGKFIHDFREQAALTRGNGNVYWFLLPELPHDLGWPALALVVTGMASLPRRPTRSALVLATFPVLYAIVLFPQANTYARYVLPEVAFLALCAGQGWTVLHDWAASRRRPSVGVALANGLLVVSLMLPAWTTVSWDWVEAMARDPRTTALAWTEKNVPDGTRLLVEAPYGKSFDNAPLVTSLTIARLERILPANGRFAAVRRAVLDAWRGGPVYQDPGWETDPGELAAGKVKYVYLTNAENIRPRPERLQGWLDRDCNVVKTFPADLPLAIRDQAEVDSHSRLPLIPPSITVCQMDRELETATAASTPR
jgi:hypothetical protein